MSNNLFLTWIILYSWILTTDRVSTSSGYEEWLSNYLVKPLLFKFKHVVTPKNIIIPVGRAGIWVIVSLLRTWYMFEFWFISSRFSGYVFASFEPEKNALVVESLLKWWRPTVCFVAHQSPSLIQSIMAHLWIFLKAVFFFCLFLSQFFCHANFLSCWWLMQSHMMSYARRQLIS